ncbi:MAG TPA: rhodanese-like domain-containing protein [Verrucomicrobiae bacterium]|nr:rhodanese-like domain-containing protein [Verrucomicrobiae bacterium]
MSWSSILIAGVGLALILGFRRLGLVSVKAARKHLKAGALIVDVRSAQEFQAGHLSDAMNIPLGELQSGLPRRVSDKSQVLLLHCLSGTRSGFAKRALKSMGYSNSFNLGSYGRAQRIVGR